MALQLPPHASADSYADLATADAYLTGEVWKTLTIGVKESLLRRATELLDDLDWRGRKNTEQENALVWPRYGMYDREGILLDDESVPVFLQRATCRLALHLYDNEPGITGDQDISELKVGSVSLKFEETVQSIATIPDYIKKMFRYYTKNRGFGIERA